MLFTLIMYLFIVKAQETVLVPEDYVLWTFNYPFSILILLYPFLLIIGLFEVLKKGSRKSRTRKRSRFSTKKKKYFVAAFCGGNILLLYVIFFGVTVITNEKVIDYSFLHPQGNEYSYEEVTTIHTGVHGKGSYRPFSQQAGRFFYEIELANGKTIDLMEVGNVANNEHEYFAIEELDHELVNRGIPKVLSMENVDNQNEYLDDIYIKKIRSIIGNTN